MNYSCKYGVGVGLKLNRIWYKLFVMCLFCKGFNFVDDLKD